ncbi:MAG: tetratricopeptide repeat protein [Gemmatimonadetes bacterium]|nr:tetratricopeptide repeat protein [Gemmatimonadota bacterium]
MKTLRRMAHEAHDRGLWQVFGIFMGGGWGLLQVLDLFIERGFFPDWVFSGALLALVLGLPVVLATAWVQGGRVEEAAKPESGAGAVENAGGVDLEDLFTWNRAIVGGLLAFALLGVVTTGYMVMRVTGIGAPATLAAQGVFEVGGRVVLADFESSAGDVAPGDLITEALRIDLGQSAAFSLVPAGEINETLQRMLREPGEPIDEEVAREIAVRVGAPAVIAGEVGRLGSGFVLTSRVSEATSGNVLASFRVTSDDEEELISAIDDLSARIRSKVGESLRSVAETKPLNRVTTTSLEALKKLTAAVHGTQRGTMAPTTAQQLLLDAVRLDSTFAAAHRALAIVIGNYGGDRELGLRSAEAAFRHGERLPERERLINEGIYYTNVVGDPRRAMEAYRSLLILDSTSVSAAINLADRHMYLGEYEEAVRLLRSHPSWEDQPYTWNLTASLVALRRHEEVVAVRDTAERIRSDDPYQGPTTALAYGMLGRSVEGRILLDSILVSGAEVPGWGHPVAMYLEANLGRLAEAEQSYFASDDEFARLATPSDRHAFGLNLPWIWHFVAQDTEGARARLEAHLERIDLESMTPFNRDYPELALVYALMGDEEMARGFVDRFEAELGDTGGPRAERRTALATAFLLLGSADPEAVPLLESTVSTLMCRRCGDFFLGHGYDVAGMHEQAIEAYQRYLEFPFYDGSQYELLFLGPIVHERLAELHDAAGNASEAAGLYRRFATLWEYADPALQPRVQAARARARELDPL